jgi:CubicO group peptidase (beta-lactamase class C family)
VDERRLRPDDRVVDHIPEFGRNGKAPITVRQLLTHTAGFRGPLNNFMPGTWEEILAKVYDLKLEPNWVPGEKAGYHIASSWFVLGELIRRVDGRAFDRYVREEIFLPLGLEDAWIGMPAERVEAYGRRLAPTVIREPHLHLGKTPWNDAEGLVVPRPGGNARGPIRALGRFYESLLPLALRKGETRGGSMATSRISDEETGMPPAADGLAPPAGPLPQGDGEVGFTRRHRVGMFDQTFKCILDFGLGFLIDSKQYAGEHPYGYGRHASADTFGHSGNQSSCAFCDPAHGLVVAWVCTGMPGERAHDERARAINAAIYEDLNLANG